MGVFPVLVQALWFLAGQKAGDVISLPPGRATTPSCAPGLGLPLEVTYARTASHANGSDEREQVDDT